jgi:hypothetical protein
MSTRPDRELMTTLGIIPKLRLGSKTKKGTVSLGPKRVKFVAVKVVTDKDPRTGKDVEYVRYLFEENGQKKKYQTKKLNDQGELSYLVQRLSEIEEGEEVILEMKKAGIKNYIDVLPVGQKVGIEVSDDEIDDEMGEDIVLE